MEETTTKERFGALKKMDSDMSVAVLALVVAVLPGIIAKIVAMNAQTTPAMMQNSLATSVSFNASTTIVAFILGLYALVRSRGNATTRMIAVITVIVCVLKFLVQA